MNSRSSHPKVLLGKGVLKICSKFTGEHPCQNAISIKLQNNFIEIALWHGCSPVNLLYIFRTPFLKTTSEWLLLEFCLTVVVNPVSLIYDGCLAIVEHLASKSVLSAQFAV